MIQKLPDGFSGPQAITAPVEKLSPELKNKLINHEQKGAAEIAAKQLFDGHKTSVIIPVHREQINHSELAQSDVSGMVENLKEQKPQPVFYRVPSTKERKADTVNKLYRETNISPGREKFLHEVYVNAHTLEVDLNRQPVTIGNITREKSYFEGRPPEVIYRYLSAHVSGYIKDENPELNVSPNKMDEILNSMSQTFRNAIAKSRNDVLPHEPWVVAGGKGKEEVKFEFESKWFGQSEVLVVTTKSTKIYTNFDDENARPKEVIMEAQVKHNLKTNDVTLVYKLSIDGKEEEWDPATRFTTPPVLLKSEGYKHEPAEKFRSTIKESHYQELKKEIQLINQ